MARADGSGRLRARYGPRSVAVGLALQRRATGLTLEDPYGRPVAYDPHADQAAAWAREWYHGRSAYATAVTRALQRATAPFSDAIRAAHIASYLREQEKHYISRHA